MKDATEITDTMLKNNYTIEVQILRERSHSVNETVKCYRQILLFHYVAGDRRDKAVQPDNEALSTWSHATCH